MKKILAIVTLFVLLTLSASAEVYPQTFIVENIEEENDLLVLLDFNDNEWEWEGIEDYAIGDVVAAIMDDNETDIIYDDEIITIRYAGYMKGWE